MHSSPNLFHREPSARIIAGTVVAVDEAGWSCTIQPDKDNVPELSNVPLRVHNLPDDLGVIVIPEVNSPCLVDFLEGSSSLPVLLRCQRWSKIIIKKGSTTEIVFDAEGNVYIKALGTIQLGPQGQHKGAWGDKWLEKFNQHVQMTPCGPSSVPQPLVMDSDVNSQKVKLD
jgi:hypothetical protein